MAIYPEVQFMVVSDRKPYTAARMPLTAIRKDPGEIRTGEGTVKSSSVNDLIKRIHDDSKHAFQLVWKPELGYGSLFNTLKGEKSKVTISLYFFIREDDEKGKVLWSGTARADGVTVENCICNGKSRNGLETVDIKSTAFS